jgi:hypothetical protein
LLGEPLVVTVNVVETSTRWKATDGMSANLRRVIRKPECVLGVVGSYVYDQLFLRRQILHQGFDEDLAIFQRHPHPLSSRARGIEAVDAGT